MRSLLALVLFTLVGCATDDNLGSTSQSVVIDNRLSANRLSANRLSANRLSANRLSANRLSANRLQLGSSADDLINSVEGRDVLTYIISCAVPEGTTFVGTDSNGVSYEFFGEIGLAPDWIHHALSQRASRWVSACLFARVNGHNVAVPVSLRGPSHALATTPTEVANWTLQEAAFYGQYFTPITQPIEWFACTGRDAVAAESVERDCSLPDPANPGFTRCGFNYAGDCGDYGPPPNKTACRRFSPRGYYQDCASTAIFHVHNDGEATEAGDDFDGDENDDHIGQAERFRQVITTYVQ